MQDASGGQGAALHLPRKLLKKVSLEPSKTLSVFNRSLSEFASLNGTVIDYFSEI
jgi:hypothetical protein